MKKECEVAIDGGGEGGREGGREYLHVVFACNLGL
jgi:hypothetical protein